MFSKSVFGTFPWPQFDVSPSAVRRGIVVASAAQKRRSSVAATSSDDAAPDGAKSKSTTAGYKDAAPDGAATQNTALSRDAIAKIASWRRRASCAACAPTDDNSLSHEEKLERVHAILYGWERSAGGSHPVKSSYGV